MTTFCFDTLHLLVRHIRTTLRIPIWIAVSLVQPIIWLTLYGQLFRRVVELPGFSTTSYIQFLTPGVVIMTAFFGSAWSGLGLIHDIHEGVMDRLLTTPIRRGALIAGRVLHAALTVVVQAVLILLFGLVLGARLPGGVGAALAVLLLAGLLGAGFSALSNGIALLTRREETLVAVINFFGMPLTFLSTALMASELMPGWIRFIAQGNPVNWAINGARAAMIDQDWAPVWYAAVLLAAFVFLACFVATQAFQAYRRAV